MKIALFELEDWQKRRFRSHLGKDNELCLFSEPINEENLAECKDAEAMVVFVNSHLTKEVLDQFPHLKFITTMSTGYDHIDLDECKKRNIVLATVPTYGEITVAEHTFALILAVSRRIIECHERVKSGLFSPQGLTGFDLSGKTIGVVGVGGIGKHVIGIAKGFGMNVLGYKRSPDPELEKELGITLTDFDTLLSKSDVVTFHVPYSPETHHMMNVEKFHIIKKGAVIINTARGSIIETRALLQALEDKTISGAGLDVCEGEPLLREEIQLLSHEFNQEELMFVLEERMLLHYPNVVITPHNAFNSHEALERIINTTMDNILQFQAGKPQNVVE